MSRQDARAVERTAAAMETLIDSGVTQVDPRRVLQLLGREASDPQRAPERPPALDPLADPMTGCLPVTAPGGHRDGTEEARRGFRA